MKKLLCLLLVSLLTLGLCGCIPLSLVPGEGGGEDGPIFIPDDTSYGYYYDQLSDDAKTVYRSIYKDCLNTEGIPIVLREPLTFTEAADDEGGADEEIRDALMRITQPAIDALQYDHPQIFWIRMGEGGSTFSIASRSKENEDGSKTVSVQTLTFYMKTRHISEGSTPAEEWSALEAAIAAFGVGGEDRYTQLASIHDLLAERVTYDGDAARPHIASGALVDGRAVCDGYAKAVKVLCDALEIPCIVVAGQAVQVGVEPHAWNYVQMEDGLWYALDATWDDRGDHAEDAYFLVGANTLANNRKFSESHLPRGSFSDGTYEPFVLPALAGYRYQTLIS